MASRPKKTGSAPAVTKAGSSPAVAKAESAPAVSNVDLEKSLKQMTILEHVEQENNFNEFRKEALDNPLMAQDRLAPYATLTVKIIKARGLMAADYSFFGSGKSDPYADILLNDVSQKQTKKISSNLSPTWNESCVIDIDRPGSVLQVFVLDHDLIGDDDLLGFVEMPVADLPLGSSVNGWFVLSKPESLGGTAPARLAKALVEPPPEETHGAVHLELTLNITSGDLTDEFYAWCLPNPTFKDFPVPEPDTPVQPAGLKALDAQRLADTVIEIKESLLDDYWVPLIAGFMYILAWHEPKLSVLVLLVAIHVGLHPLYVFQGIFAVASILLLATSSEKRRRHMAAHPGLVPLNDLGYELMSELRDTNKVESFLARTVVAMNGKVESQKKLRVFAAFCHHQGKPVTTFADLKKQLRDSVKALPNDPMVSFSPKPHPPGFLVAHENRPGEIVMCVNPKEETPKYKMKLKDGEEVEVSGEELETCLDLRWVNSQIVLAMIPDATENQLMDLLEPLQMVRDIVRFSSNLTSDIVCWKHYALSAGCLVACLVLTAVFGFIASLGLPPIPGFVIYTIGLIYVVAVAGGIALLFMMNAMFFISFVARVKAHLKVKEYAEKSAMVKWPFYSAMSSESEVPRVTPRPNGGGCMEGIASCGDRDKSSQQKKKKKGTLVEPLIDKDKATAK